MAGGASTSKSYDMAKIAALFWLANPMGRGTIVASTTLESLGARIWGYTTKLLSSMKVKLPFQYLGGNNPKVLYPAPRSENQIRDTIHGMFAVAVKSGSDEQAISSWIGRHPEEALMVVLDESTDMNPAILKAFANLEAGSKPFQAWGIGNSNSKFDLHGAMSTPRAGWESINPKEDNHWETTQKNGICLFFSCYESPAIFEQDPYKKEQLSKFLITQPQIEEKKITYGEDSDSFWRFVLGYWRSAAGDSTVLSEAFLKNYKVGNRSEWGGLYPLRMVGGLDPSFSIGGDDCILRLAVLGVAVDGSIVLDFREEELMFKLQIHRSLSDAIEIQIVKQMDRILTEYRCPLENICFDATGAGRALGSAAQIYMKSMKPPLKIWSSKAGNVQGKSFDVLVKPTYELWYTLREFVENGQVRGLDHKTIMQLSSRLIELKNGKYTLEPKAAYKKRMGAVNPGLAHSPDHADSAALALHSAIYNFGFSLGQRRETPKLEGTTAEKYWVFSEMQRKKKEAEEVQVKRAVPVMSFTGEIEALKLPEFPR